jgi:hypothetical protein
LVGLASVTKLVGGVALLALLVSEPLRGPWRHRTTGAAAAAATGLVVLAPFVALAGVGLVWDLLVVTQLRRPGHDEAGGSIDGIVDRLDHLGSYGPFTMSRVSSLGLLGALVATIVVVWAWRTGGPIGRFLAASVVLGSVAILTAPDYYDQYPVIVFTAISVALGGAVEVGLGALARGRPQAHFIGAVTVVLLVAIGGLDTVRAVQGRLDGAPRSDFGALVASRVGTDCVAGDFPEQLLAANRLPPEDAAGNRLLDPFGGLIHEALRDGDYATTELAIHSRAAQDRLRESLAACPYAVTYGRLDEPPPWWSETTRTWFQEEYEPWLETTAGPVLWRRLPSSTDAPPAS